MNKRYACSDLHGMWNLWKQISEYCDKTDVIYFLGDANDRGPDGIKIIQSLLTDKRVKYIRGNHEEILVDAVEERDGLLLCANGGVKTYEDFYSLDPYWQEIIVNRLNYLPNQLEYINTKGQHIILNHSGSMPEKYESWKKSLIGKNNPYTWDRHHITKEWDGDENTYIVHGHTPTVYIMATIDPAGAVYRRESSKDKVINYCNGHKFDLDIASFATKKIALFDLDTLTVEKYFEVKED